MRLEASAPGNFISSKELTEAPGRITIMLLARPPGRSRWLMGTRQPRRGAGNVAASRFLVLNLFLHGTPSSEDPFKSTRLVSRKPGGAGAHSRATLTRKIYFGQRGVSCSSDLP